jgi:four helix bundle protein
MAKGSTGEVKAQLYVAADQEYLDNKTFDKLYMLTAEISKMIAGLMNYIRTSKIKGVKYKK